MSASSSRATSTPMKEDEAWTVLSDNCFIHDENKRVINAFKTGIRLYLRKDEKILKLTKK